MPAFHRSIALGLLMASLAAGAASAQLLPSVGVPNIGGPVGGVVNGVGTTINHTVGRAGSSAEQVSPSEVRRATMPSLQRLTAPEWVLEATPQMLAELRRLRLQQLVRQNSATLTMDPAGNPARRDRLVMLDPSPSAIAGASSAGFAIIADDKDEALGIRAVVLAIPRGMKLRQAAVALQRAAPGAAIEYDHVFEPAGGALSASSVALAASATAAAGQGPVIGMIDGGVASSPALANATIEQRGFSGPAEATGHGTAIASLIVGADGHFRGAAPNASLFVGDVYGGNSAAGSATSIFKAMAWLVAKRPGVINVSLVGPRNRLVERAVAAVQARGIKVIAAVGNDGPAAPPLFPASQAGVVAVTAVDARNRALAEAGKAAHLDYAAPGADMAAALPGKGYAKVRGTSFAAPLVASRLALTGSIARLDAEAAKGHGRVGRGIVCASCRIAPKVVKAK